MERRADTSDDDILPEPQSLPRLKNYVPHRERTSGPRFDRRLIQEVNARGYATYPDYGTDYIVAGNGTVTVVEVKNTYLPSSHMHGGVVADADPTGVVITRYGSLSSSVEQGLLDISSLGKPEPLADYDAYAVDNWDAYGALPISVETLHAARSILKSLPKTFGDPVCSPGADGSIVFEWLRDDGPLRKLFIDMGPGRTWKAYWRLADGKIGTIPRKRVTISTILELQKLFDTLLHG